VNLFTNPNVENIFILPVAADLHLTEGDRADYRRQIGHNFRLRVGMGGDDVHPRLYNENITHSMRVSYTRDASEVALIRSYQTQPGLYFGICRGHQIGAIARGDRMYQDLSKDGVADTNFHSQHGDYLSHAEKWHSVNLVHPLLIELFERTQIETNSYHHQAVRLAPGSRSLVGGYATEDRIVEALVSEDGKSIGLQFHTEIPATDPQKQNYNDLRIQFTQRLVTYTQYILRHAPPYRSCRLVL